MIMMATMTSTSVNPGRCFRMTREGIAARIAACTPKLHAVANHRVTWGQTARCARNARHVLPVSLVMERHADEPITTPLTTPSAANPITYRIDHDRGVVFVTASGGVTVEALRSANATLRADSRFSSGMHVYLECRVVTSLPTADELRTLALASIIRQAEARYGRVAIVATTASCHEAASTFCFFCEPAPDRLALFTDPREARGWLGLGPPTGANEH